MIADGTESEPPATEGQRRDLHEVKIFGERNTGTTALKRLIERNSSTTVCPSVAKELDPLFGLKMKVLRRAPGRYRRRLTETYIDRLFSRVTPRLAWKHTATAFDEIQSLDGCPVIVMTRHPASWLLGLHHHPYHALVSVDRDFSAFLRAYWILVKRDNLDHRALLPGDLWNYRGDRPGGGNGRDTAGGSARTRVLVHGAYVFEDVVLEIDELLCAEVEHRFPMAPPMTSVDFVVESDRAQLREIVQRVRDGRLRTTIGTVSTLDDAVAAFNSTKRRKGKTIISVRP